MGKNSKQRRQATAEEWSWAREYMDLFVPCNNGYNVIISKKGNMLIRHVAGGDIVSIPKASIASRQAFDKYLRKCQCEKEEQKKRLQRELEKQRERMRMEKEAAEKEAHIRNILQNELKTAVSEINRNKEITKLNQIFGEARAEASVKREAKYNVLAEIKVTLYLMHKSTAIGRLVEATRSISTLADDNELNAAFLKKKIMSVAKSPVQDMSITPYGAMHIYEMTCKYLKKQKDMKVDENLWMAANENKRQILRLVYAVSSRKMQTPDCYVGDFLNSKFKNGRICFVLNNYSFAYDIANDFVTMDEQQKTELCLLAKRLNAQKKTIKICQKTIESLQAEGLQDDLNMSYALKDENIVIRGKRCLGKLIIASDEKITGTEIKKWLKNSRKEYELEQKRKQEEKEAELRSLQSYGSLVAIDALRLIAKNERYITENAVVKNLRGMSQTLQSDIEDIENSGKYGLLTGEEVKKAIHILDNDGLIYQQEIEGTYGWFYILKLRDKAKDLLSIENKQKKKPFGEFTDIDWVNYLEKFHVDGKEPRLTNEQKQEQMTFFDHKAVAVLYPELTKEFLKTKPKEWQMYIETIYSMAAGVEKKYWKFLKDMVVEKKERKKKKEAETEGTKTEPAA